MPTDDPRERRRHNRELYILIADVVTEWDPYGLMAVGGGADERDDEIFRLTAAVPRIHSPADAIAAIAQVFSDSFGPDDFGLDRCTAVGETLFAALRTDGFISDAMP